MPDSQALKDHIQTQIQQNKIEADPVQTEAITLLQEIATLFFQHPQSSQQQHQNYSDKNSKENKKNKLFWWHTTAQITPKLENVLIKGLYIWGDVGRGKTWLMDQFYDIVDVREKKRWHYHQFMLEIHQSLASFYSQADPLDIVAKRMAQKYRLICLDEFHVMDIADAVILHGLLRGLFEHGVTLVTTSNRHPDELYKNGSHRQRFLPAIELLKQNTTVFELDNSKDYRLDRDEQGGVFFSPHDDNTDKLLQKKFKSYVQSHVPEKTQSQLDKAITIYGREIPVILVAATVIWFDFNTICRGARSSSDYIQIANQYKTVFISEIPILHTGEEGPARRFLNLVDEFYDQHVFLILSSEVSLDKMYQGGLLTFEFKRALSRLQEMQSRSYWAGF